MHRKDEGWSSDRTVPLPRVLGGKDTNCTTSIVRNHPVNTSPLSPLASGRTLPSKWDDAERWICSPTPVSSLHHHHHDKDGGSTPSLASLAPPHRPKSNSGPLGQPSASLDASAVAGHVDSSSVNHCFSPFNTGVMAADDVLLGRVRRKAGVLDERFDGIGLEDDGGIDDPRTISRRDMATQMSPRSSICSSPKARASFSNCHSPPSRGEFPARTEVRDVAIDKRATIISWSKRHASRISGKPWWTYSRDRSDGFSQEVVEASAWQFGDRGKNPPWVQKEEARITAWENLQKAKAEAAIRKLEMKLEKKRSSSMGRILGKLKAAEAKAREMRGSLSQDHDNLRRKKPIRRWFRCDAF
ncbi:hypothetical protein MLD38_004594 [Melastoma candidum]|uniref:Uncharacterized protein n=1 Tax=Melastoma candidum TaxID=119954 RepID=A0ACB9S630_9MYRT|nr:hypothetical protein MLD38_004594 [Melastoma candidum]